ncbi:hypothetical protein NA57DRAFT_62194 [Rhizodiscina lignyota]|uniref:Uncharacterized protein n=1 Tax=Rhizodiscina lignyota TaxID=1504668 RepID=A0A9P4M0N7_9PEZI|nr:hypothetical protein NA57DRAFT_62194 [Rhizodiscina lignyota]
MNQSYNIDPLPRLLNSKMPVTRSMSREKPSSTHSAASQIYPKVALTPATPKIPVARKPQESSKRHNLPMAAASTTLAAPNEQTPQSTESPSRLTIHSVEDESLDTLHTPQPLSFLALPGEIRNMIYRFALLADVPLKIRVESAPQEPPLLCTCHQIRAEARKIFYSDNGFSVHSTNYSVAPVLKFLKQHRIKEDGIQFSFRRYSKASLDGPSRYENEIEYIEAWYSGACNLRPTRKGCFKENPMKRDNFVKHQFWSIAKKMKEQGAAWAVAKAVLDSAGNLLEAGIHHHGFKPTLSRSCCTDPQNTSKN